MKKTKPHELDEATSAKLLAHFEKHNVPVLSPEELAAVRADQFVDDDLLPRSKRGRPKKGESRPTVGKTVKEPPAFWAALEAKAQAQGMSVHEAMRQALAQWLAQ